MKRILLSLLALAGIVLPASACGVAVQVGYAAPAVAFAPAISYAQTSLSYAAPCPAVAPAAPMPYAEPVPAAVANPCPPAVVESLATYTLPAAVEFLNVNYGYSAVQAVEVLRVHRHAEALTFVGDANAIVVEDRFRNGVEFGRRGKLEGKGKVKVKRRKKK